MKIAKVLWIDAVFFDRDMTIKKALKLRPCAVTTVGFLVADEPTHVTLAQGLDEDDNVSELFVVPRGMIANMTILGDA